MQAAAQIGKARVEGAHLDSQWLRFEPSELVAGEYEFDIGTAGATSLVLQTLYLPLTMTSMPSLVCISGGTHVPWSPCFHYLDIHWRHFLENAGFHLDLRMERPGFYPRGGGMIAATIEPSERLRPLQLIQRGRLKGIQGISAVANLPSHIARRQKDRALYRLQDYDADCTIDILRLGAYSRGTFLVLLAQFEYSQACFFALGARGKPAERVADEAVDEMLTFLDTDGAIDPYLADQLLLPLAFVGGESLLRTAKITSHLLTNIEIIRLFRPAKLRVHGRLGEAGTIHING